MRLHCTLAAVMLASCSSPPAPAPAQPSEAERLQRCASNYRFVASFLRRDIPAYPVALQRAQELTQRLAALDAIGRDTAEARVADSVRHREQAGAQREPALNLGFAMPETQGCDRIYGYPLFDPVPPGSPPPVPLSPQPQRS
jgi:hypothetical protein